jgi:hypothetical protein
VKNDFDPYEWFTVWLEEQERHRSWLIVEMHEPLKVGNEVSIVAIVCFRSACVTSAFSSPYSHHDINPMPGRQ